MPAPPVLEAPRDVSTDLDSSALSAPTAFHGLLVPPGRTPGHAERAQPARAARSAFRQTAGLWGRAARGHLCHLH